ncbi:hypothetical protein K491DRAFT_783718 [Lophiostoma macrostomum CBS 122681]|uniref:Uncharacterized protein n=1 Tax=Lophiostoma macrostomum CBS 122681 TaxID=1314788 RepID=A0A6A6SMU2_9PLEO|nr:hypothetical protein K491DRAFT_783718 [Lophiostoma macrostomum CBS 122681]
MTTRGSTGPEPTPRLQSSSSKSMLAPQRSAPPPVPLFHATGSLRGRGVLIPAPAAASAGLANELEYTIGGKAGHGRGLLSTGSPLRVVENAGDDGVGIDRGIGIARGTARDSSLEAEAEAATRRYRSRTIEHETREVRQTMKEIRDLALSMSHDAVDPATEVMGREVQEVKVRELRRKRSAIPCPSPRKMGMGMGMGMEGVSPRKARSAVDLRGRGKEGKGGDGEEDKNNYQSGPNLELAASLGGIMSAEVENRQEKKEETSHTKETKMKQGGGTLKVGRTNKEGYPTGKHVRFSGTVRGSVIPGTIGCLEPPLFEKSSDSWPSRVLIRPIGSQTGNRVPYLRTTSVPPAPALQPATIARRSDFAPKPEKSPRSPISVSIISPRRPSQPQVSGGVDADNWARGSSSEKPSLPPAGCDVVEKLSSTSAGEEDEVKNATSVPPQSTPAPDLTPQPTLEPSTPAPEKSTLRLDTKTTPLISASKLSLSSPHGSVNTPKTKSKNPDKELGTPPALRRAIEEDMQHMRRSMRESIGTSPDHQRKATSETAMFGKLVENGDMKPIGTSQTMLQESKHQGNIIRKRPSKIALPFKPTQEKEVQLPGNKTLSADAVNSLLRQRNLTTKKSMSTLPTPKKTAPRPSVSTLHQVPDLASTRHSPRRPSTVHASPTIDRSTSRSIPRGARPSIFDVDFDAPTSPAHASPQSARKPTALRLKPILKPSSEARPAEVEGIQDFKLRREPQATTLKREERLHPSPRNDSLSQHVSHKEQKAEVQKAVASPEDISEFIKGIHEEEDKKAEIFQARQRAAEKRTRMHTDIPGAKQLRRVKSSIATAATTNARVKQRESTSTADHNNPATQKEKDKERPSTTPPGSPRPEHRISTTPPGSPVPTPASMHLPTDGDKARQQKSGAPSTPLPTPRLRRTSTFKPTLSKPTPSKTPSRAIPAISLSPHTTTTTRTTTLTSPRTSNIPSPSPRTPAAATGLHAYARFWSREEALGRGDGVIRTPSREIQGNLDMAIDERIGEAGSGGKGVGKGFGYGGGRRRECGC